MAENNMIIVFDHHFKKQLRKLKKGEQTRFYDQLRLLVVDPVHPSLEVHELKGARKNYSSMNVGGDFRAIFLEKNERNENVLFFVDIGRHHQLYGK